MENDVPSSKHRAAFGGGLLLLAALAFLSFGLRTISHGSFWMHLASGRHIAQEGIPTQDPFSFTTDAARTWVNPEWFYDLLLFRAWTLTGAAGIVALHAALGLAAFLLALASSRTLAMRQAAAFTLLLCGWLVAPVFQVSPILPALFFSGVAMLTLSRLGARPAAWLILLPTQLLWTNTHASFVLAPLIAAAYAVEAGMLARRPASGSPAPGTRPYLLLAAALAAITLLNPYGLALHRTVLASVTQPALGVLVEWVSPFQGEFAPTLARHVGTLVLILVASGFIFVRERLPVAPTTLAVAGAFLLVLSPRYVLFSGLLVAPFIALSLHSLAVIIHRRLGEGHALLPSLATATRAALALLILSTLLLVTTNRYHSRSGSASAFGFGVTQDLFPEAACASILMRDDFPDRAINLAADGGYLAWTRPERRIFTDTRVPVYGAPFYQGLARGLLGQAETWTNLMERWDPGAVILNTSWPGAGSALRRLLDEKRWSLVYFDGISAILVLRTTEHRALISDLAQQVGGLRLLEKNRKELAQTPPGLRTQPVPARLLGAGTVYLALWRFREAEAVYEALTPHVPGYATGWMNLGIARVQLKKSREALPALNRARQLRSDSALAWLWMGRAYAESGADKEAAWARQKARNINAAMADAFERGGDPSTNAPPSLKL